MRCAHAAMCNECGAYGRGKTFRASASVRYPETLRRIARALSATQPSGGLSLLVLFIALPVARAQKTPIQITADLKRCTAQAFSRRS